MDTISPTQSRRTVRQLIFLLVALLAVGLLVPAALGGPVEAADSRIQNTFGCAGTLVISNTDCAMGVANAHDNFGIAASPRVEVPNGLAPWCDAQPNRTVYGCLDRSDPVVATAAKGRRARQVECDQPVANACESPAWLLDVMAELAENKVRADACLALTDPGPECTP